jgi:hypothetical protein
MKLTVNLIIFCVILTVATCISGKIQIECLSKILLKFHPDRYGKRSELRKSQHRKPKRTSKNLETITTSKMAF